MIGSLPERQVWAKPVAMRRVRQLDFEGRVVVREGDVVQSNDVVARGQRPSPPVLVPVARALGLSDAAIDRYLVRRYGETVSEGEVLARKSGILGLGARSCQSPAAGTLDPGPPGSGELVVTPPPQDVELRAHLAGSVVSALPHRGVVVELAAVGVQGIAGCGGEGGGRVRVLAGPQEAIASTRISTRLANAVVVGGTIDLASLRRLAVLGAAGAVVGSVRASTFEAYLAERNRVPLVVTEGFGEQGMAQRCFDVLREYQGREARIQGGESRRPDDPAEVLIPVDDHQAARARPVGVELGALIRIVAGSYAFAVGQIVAVGAAPMRFESGLVSRWLDVRLDDGGQVRVPVVNVEIVGI